MSRLSDRSWVSIPFGCGRRRPPRQGARLGQIRRCARAELYRRISRDGTPTSWALRMLNGVRDQMMTVLLPNPFLGDHQELLPEPHFDRLATWDQLRARYLSLPRIPSTAPASASVTARCWVGAICGVPEVGLGP
ncbi:DUF7676 family protein [Frankia tisae]|uniref:DUF7676 family protein n=1 Tax=Frankia tisae TaxID=2950104 RepID=UPI003F68690F